MGQSNVLTGGWALIAWLVGLLAPLCGQGPVYRERWAYLHLENRRLELLRALLPVDPAKREAAAKLLAEPDLGVPFVPVAKAMAHVRGVAADPTFVLRSTVSVFVLPEVADPEGRNEVCHETNVSVYLPYSLPLPQELAFDFEVYDKSGKRVWGEQLTGEMPIEDLRMARLARKVPCGDLPDGTYQLHVRTVVDGQAPGAEDPVLQWPLHVMRGYQARCEAALVAARAEAPKLPELPRALLEGCLLPVHRAYFGEAFDGCSTAVEDLLRLELALRNVANGKPVLAGMTGDVPTALPGTERPLACVLRLPVPLEARHDGTQRPLLVFAAAAPCFDISAHRPSAPGTRGPSWLALEMPGVGGTGAFDVAFVDSPGEGRDYATDLGRAITALRDVLGTGDRPVVLVCDREAASVIGLRMDAVRRLLAGLVLVGSGGMTGPALDALGSLPVRFVPLCGYPGTEGQRRSLDYVTVRREQGAWSGDVQSLIPSEPTPRHPAWPFGVPLLAESIESFAAAVFAR